jgi:DNA-directed RNA polymerase alpha subunit
MGDDVDALHRRIAHLQMIIKQMIEIGAKADVVDVAIVDIELLACPFEEKLELSVRISNALRNDGAVTLGDVVKLTEGELLRMPNFGRKSLAELKEALASLGLQCAL